MRRLTGIASRTRYSPVRVKPWLLLAMVILSGCVLDGADVADQDDVGLAQEALATQGRSHDVPPGKDAPVVEQVSRRTPLDVRIREALPRWEVYRLPQGLSREVPILAVPKDGRGVPVLLDFEHHHRHPQAFFPTILKSGYVSLLDLQVILKALEGRVPLWDREAAWDADPWQCAPKGTVDPFVTSLAPTRRPRSFEESGPTGPVSYPGDIDDHTYAGGPPPLPPSYGQPTHGGTGNGMGAGGHGGTGPSVPVVANPQDELDPKVPVAQRMEAKGEEWLAANGESAAHAVEDTPLVPSMAALCSAPEARSVAGTGGAPCELVPKAEEMRVGDTIGSWFKRTLFGGGRGAACEDACASLGFVSSGAAASAIAGLCLLVTNGAGSSICTEGATAIVAAGATATSPGGAYLVTYRACVRTICTEK